MRIYNITKGQLITMWIFGIITCCVSLVEINSYEPSPFAGTALLLIPAFLIFYAIGWRAHKKLERKVGTVEIEKEYCTECGKQVSKEGKYCNFCGKKIYV